MEDPLGMGRFIIGAKNESSFFDLRSRISSRFARLNPVVLGDLTECGMHSPADLMMHYIAGAKELQEIPLKKAHLISDFHTRIDYSAARKKLLENIK